MLHWLVRDRLLAFTFFYEFCVICWNSTERDYVSERVDFNEIYVPLCIQKSRPSRFRLHFNELQPLLVERREMTPESTAPRIGPIECLFVFLPLLIWPVYSETAFLSTRSFPVHELFAVFVFLDSFHLPLHIAIVPLVHCYFCFLVL